MRAESKKGWRVAAKYWESECHKLESQLASQDALLEEAAFFVNLHQMEGGEPNIQVIDLAERIKASPTSSNHSDGERGGFISISERLPEVGQHVVLITTERYWCAPDGLPDMHVSATGYLANDGGHKYWAIFGERGMELNAFTHWKDLSDSCRLIEDGNKEMNDD